MAITPLPTPPSRSQSPATFSTDADAFLGALPDFATEANALATDVNADEAAAAASAATASNAANVAVGAANYQGAYSAGVTYQIGQSVSSGGRQWVAKTINTGITPVEGANWLLINDGDVVGPVSATSNALALYDGTSGKLIKSGLNNGTAGQALISGGSGNAPTWGAVESGVQQFTASGSITAGQPVSLRSDGKVEVVNGYTSTQIISAASAALSFNYTDFGVFQLNNSNEFVIIYTNTSDSSYPYYVIANGSGATVTYGAPVRITNAAASSYGFALVYDPVTNRYGFFFRSGTALWGTTASYASSVFTFQAAQALYSPISTSGTYSAKAYFDPAFNGYVVVTRDNGQGALVHTITVSGVSIARAATATLVSANSYNLYAYNCVYAGSIGVGYTTQYTGAVYQTSARSITVNGTGTVITVSSPFSAFTGSSDTLQVSYSSQINRILITYFTTANLPTLAYSSAFNATYTIQQLQTSGSYNFVLHAFDTSAQMLIATYRNNSSGRITLSTGTWTGSSFSLLDVTTDLFNANVNDPSPVFLQAVNKTAVFINSGVTRTFIPTSFTTTAYKFIGLAKQSVSNGQTVQTTTNGGVNANVTGLSTGSTYFVTYNGLVATSGVVRIGQALSATSITVDGIIGGLSGQPSASTFLRGDGAFAAIPSTVTLIASSTLTSPAASMIINNLDVTLYRSIILELKLTPENSSQNLFVSFVAPGGTSANGQLYVGYVSILSNATSVIGSNTNGGSRFVLNSENANSSSEVYTILNVQNTSQATTKRGFTFSSFGDTSSSVGHSRQGGGYSNAGSWGGFVIEPSSGNLTAGSYYRIYGVL